MRDNYKNLHLPARWPVRCIGAFDDAYVPLIRDLASLTRSMNRTVNELDKFYDEMTQYALTTNLDDYR